MSGLIALTSVVLAIVPLCLFAGLMGARPGRPAAGRGWFLRLAVSWLAGLIGGSVALTVVYVWLTRSRPLPDWQHDALVLLSAPLGAALGPGLTYLYFRMRTARDPDYGPIDRTGVD